MNGPLPALIAAVTGFLFLTLGLLRGGGPAAENPSPSSPLTPRANYQRVCGSCHPAHSPRLHRKQDWAGVVKDMGQRAGHRGMPFSEEEIRRALEFLEQHGR